MKVSHKTLEGLLAKEICRAPTLLYGENFGKVMEVLKKTNIQF